MGTQANSPISKRRFIVRRVVLGTLVAISLALFTMYFRESSGGVLHDLKSGVSAVVAPVESVVSRAIQPFQDAWGWTTGLVDARGDKARLEAENQALKAQALADAGQKEELARLQALLHIQDSVPAGYRSVNARVIERSPSPWYARARINVGTDDGVVTFSPVVAPYGSEGALAGFVSHAGASSSEVTFITDQAAEVGATVQNRGYPPGILRATGDGRLLLDEVPLDFRVEKGDIVVTAGYSRMPLPSVYPDGIPIGQVSSVGARDVDVVKTIQVLPFADVRKENLLMVLAPVSREARLRAAGG
ncbi:MAG: rod shape-determining protein MreC [Miltoncostaeaceae bacterium]|jgi:rod shape-determining protein MreC|nr:rod shape-determining protein MreC [Miltoncostaeaceae bacterium]